MRLLLLCGLAFHLAYGATAAVNILSTFSVPNSAGGSLTHGINNSGVVVGEYSGASGATHGFIYSGGAVSSLDYPGAVRTEAFGVNDSGVVAGCYYLAFAGACYNAFEYTGGAYTDISYPGIFISPAYGLNDLNQVVGTFSFPNQGGYLRSSTGQYSQFQYPDSFNTFAYGINNAGLVIGGYTAGSFAYGFLYNGASFTSIQFPGHPYAVVHLSGINNAGAVLGNVTGSGPYFFENFLYVNGQFYDLVLPGQYQSAILAGINDGNLTAGAIAGGTGFIAEIVLPSVSVPLPVPALGAWPLGFCAILLAAVAAFALLLRMPDRRPRQS